MILRTLIILCNPVISHMIDLPKAIFICEKGDLEIKSALLAASLRKALGDRIELICSIPQSVPGNRQPSGMTIRFLESLGVSILHFNNPDIPEQAEELSGMVYSNKLYCFPEEPFNGKVIFLDSDMLCIKFPEQLLFSTTQFSGCQAFRSLEIDWNELYETFNIAAPRLRVRSLLDHKIDFPYFNSGLWMIEGQKLESFLQEWRQIFSSLRISLTDKKHLNHSDQISLSLAIHKLGLTYETLPEDFNYPSGSLLVNKRTYLAHYHGPEAISRDPLLHGLVMKLVRMNPDLENIARPFPFWKELITRRVNRVYLYQKFTLGKFLKRNFKLPL